jgi:hypothetical protein
MPTYSSCLGKPGSLNTRPLKSIGRDTYTVPAHFPSKYDPTAVSNKGRKKTRESAAGSLTALLNILTNEFRSHDCNVLFTVHFDTSGG